MALAPYAGRDTNRTGGGRPRPRDVTRVPEGWVTPVLSPREVD